MLLKPLVSHPLRSIPNYKNKVFPLRLHGDRRRGRSLDVLPLSSGFATESSWDSKWLVFAIGPR